nr:killer cell lectin-like receptor subfamily B member 1 isoform X2 [Dasypus novemcinctus]
MDMQVTYAELHLPRECALGSSPPPLLPQMIFLRQKPMDKSNMEAEVYKNETIERPRPLECPVDWHPLQEKCLFFSDTFKSWSNSSSDCHTKKSSLLLIQDQKELRHIQRLINTGGLLFWIGLNFSLSERNWKWINGSFFDSDILRIIGDAEENNCVYITNKNIFSDICDIENKWICQKEPKPVTDKVCPDT